MTNVIYPRISEKSYGMASNSNVYVFNVPDSCNKIEIQKMVETLYNVKVLTVNVLNTVGKPKRSVRKGGRQNKGQRADYKKAYVTVAKGQTIPVFAAEDTKGDK
jgi:large subunit ribosomal protein L23